MNIDHYMTEDVICPYCGKKSPFDDENQTSEDCDHCGKEFWVERDYTVYYITSKIENKGDKNEIG